MKKLENKLTAAHKNEDFATKVKVEERIGMRNSPVKELKCLDSNLFKICVYYLNIITFNIFSSFSIPIKYTKGESAQIIKASRQESTNALQLNYGHLSFGKNVLS